MVSLFDTFDCDEARQEIATALRRVSVRGGKNLVDGRRLELPTSALRTRRSPN
jgi:hypothetical protein